MTVSEIEFTNDFLTAQSWHIIESLLNDGEALCVADPNLPDYPIVYVSAGFTLLTGYQAHEIIGRNARHLQPWRETGNVGERRILRKAVRDLEDTSVTLVNCRKDGSIFYNHLHVFPLLDEASHTAFIVGVQYEVSAPMPRTNL